MIIGLQAGRLYIACDGLSSSDGLIMSQLDRCCCCVQLNSHLNEQEEQERAILDPETQRQKTGSAEVDDTSKLWLAAAKAADATRAAEGRTTSPSKAWSNVSIC